MIEDSGSEGRMARGGNAAGAPDLGIGDHKAGW